MTTNLSPWLIWSRKLDALAVAEAEMDAEVLHTVVENDEDDGYMTTDKGR